MSETKPEFKLMTKRDFLSVKNKYEDINPKIEETIDSASDFDVLVLTVREGSRLNILNVKIINEDSEDVFVSILKEGVSNV